MTEQCEQIDSKLDKHLDIYSRNNHELKRLADAVEKINATMIKHIQNTEDYKTEREKDEKEFKEKLDPVIKFYDGITFTQKALLYLVGALSAIGGFYLLIRNIIK